MLPNALGIKFLFMSAGTGLGATPFYLRELVGVCQKADLQDNNAFALSGRNNVTISYPGRCPGLTAALRPQRAVV